MLSTTFLFALDNTIVADIQPAIVNEFSKVELLPWIGTGFALGNMTILSWGKAYGIFNMKWVYLFNIILFEVGSAICGAAPNMNALIVGRIIAGVGGSGMYSGTLTYVSILTNDREKPAYLAGSTVIWGIGSVLGPVVSLSMDKHQIMSTEMSPRSAALLLQAPLLGAGYDTHHSVCSKSLCYLLIFCRAFISILSWAAFLHLSMFYYFPTLFRNQPGLSLNV
jgi:MFS family permease